MGMNILDKKTVLIGLLIIAIVVWYMFSGQGLPDHGPRVDEIRNDISAVGNQQQQAIDSIRESREGLKITEDSAKRVSEGIGGVAHSIEQIEHEIRSNDDNIRDSASFIGEGKQLIKKIRARNELKE